MKGGQVQRQLKPIYLLYIYLFPLNKTLRQKETSKKTEENSRACNAFPKSPSLLTSVLEKQISTKDSQRIYSSYHSSCVRRKEMGGFFPALYTWIQTPGFISIPCLCYCQIIYRG